VTLQGIRQHLLDVLHVLARAAALMLQHAPCLAGKIMDPEKVMMFLRSYIKISGGIPPLLWQ